MNTGMVGAGEMAHVFFVHSPITYSIALACIREQGLVRPILVGGRAIRGDAIDCEVEDDGCWSIERTCELLARIIRHVPEQAHIALYMPHTAMLFGKLIKMSRRVDQLYYLEEGYTSANPAFIDRPFATTPVNVEALTHALQQADMISAWQLDMDALAQINTVPEVAFDTQNRQYAGCFTCAPDAFAGMPHVKQLMLQPAQQRRPVHLISFFGMFNRYGTGEEGRAKVIAACRLLMDITRSVRGTCSPEQQVLVKLHPVDQRGLPDSFYAALRQLGVDYASYCQLHQLDINTEPALHNFEHYYTFGETALVKYVKLLLGPARLTEYVGQY